MEPPQPLTSAIAAEKCAIDLLRGLADAVASAPRSQKADALRLLTPSLAETERVARHLGLLK